MSKIKVLIVDDHRILREAMALLLNHVEDIAVMSTFASGEEAVAEFANYQPDVILMDIILMGGMTGLETTRWIKEQAPNIKVIIVSSEVSKDYVSLGIQCGIDGYLPKDTDKDTLIEAIRRVHKGEKYFNQAIMNLIFEDFYKKEKQGTSKTKKNVEGVSKREEEVLALVAEGKTNSEIAEVLYISVKTVESHKANILEKLGLKNTAELVRYAIKNNIISAD